MIHYHGLPITPNSAALAAVGGGHAFVSFRHPDQLTLAIEYCQSFAVDNGAFSAWTAGKPVADWRPFYEWVADLHRLPPFDFAVIPDVIDGDEAANDALIEEWPWVKTAPHIGAPVWHMHESLDRLERLAMTFPRICFGSSGQYATVGTKAWWGRMNEVMSIVTDRQGRPVCKLHGLRMLNVKVFSKLPLASADSTNIGRNIGIDSAWKGTYTPPSKDVRAAVMRSRIEAVQSPPCWDRRAMQSEAGLLWSLE